MSHIENGNGTPEGDHMNSQERFEQELGQFTSILSQMDEIKRGVTEFNLDPQLALNQVELIRKMAQKMNFGNGLIEQLLRRTDQIMSRMQQEIAYVNDISFQTGVEMLEDRPNLRLGGPVMNAIRETQQRVQRQLSMNSEKEQWPMGIPEENHMRLGMRERFENEWEQFTTSILSQVDEINREGVTLSVDQRFGLIHSIQKIVEETRFESRLREELQRIAVQIYYEM